MFLKTHVLYDLKEFCSCGTSVWETMAHTMLPKRLRNICILLPVNQTNNVFRHLAVRKYGYELKWAVREAQHIMILLLLLGYIDLNKKCLKVDVKIFQLHFCVCFISGRLSFFAYQATCWKKAKGKKVYSLHHKVGKIMVF